MIVTFDLGLDDLLAANHQVARRRGRLRALRWLLLVLPVLVYAVSSARGASQSAALLWALATIVSVAAALFWLAPLAARLRIRRDFHRYPEFRGPVSYELTGEGFRFTTPASQLQLAWDAFTAAHEDPAFVYLDVGSSASYFIPKRALSQDALEQLRSVIVTNLPISVDLSSDRPTDG